MFGVGGAEEGHIRAGEGAPRRVPATRPGPVDRAAAGALSYLPVPGPVVLNLPGPGVAGAPGDHGTHRKTRTRLPASTSSQPEPAPRVPGPRPNEHGRARRYY